MRRITLHRPDIEILGYVQRSELINEIPLSMKVESPNLMNLYGEYFRMPIETLLQKEKPSVKDYIHIAENTIVNVGREMLTPVYDYVMLCDYIHFPGTLFHNEFTNTITFTYFE